MTESVKTVTLINIIFIITLMLSGNLSGWLGEVVYYLAFIIPVAFGIAASDKLKFKREEERGLAEKYNTLFEFDKKRVLKLLPLIVPIVTVVFLISFVSSLILSLVGIRTPAVEDEGIIKMLLVHALAPAILEESVFRYIPMKLLKPYSKRWCVIYSAICFSLIHCNFAQMPYAFIAGMMFMLVDIAFDSVWPSIVLHFINNATSVVWMKYCSGMTESLIFISVIAFLTLVSLFFVYRKRHEYKEDFVGAFLKGEKMPVTYAPLALAAICCCVAAASI